jgi:hypothetical protein
MTTSGTTPPGGSLGGRQRAGGRGARRPASRWIQVGLGFFILLLGANLIYILVALWPAVDAATGNKAHAVKINLYGFAARPAPNTTLLLLVVLASSLGSYIHAATSFADYTGNRRLNTSWVWWYVLRPTSGVALAVLFYFAIRGGFVGGNTDASVVNPYGIAAIAGMVGLFSKQATDKLREVFDTLFKASAGYGDAARGDPISNPQPVIDNIEPSSLAVGATTLDLTITGEGFIPQSAVRVARRTNGEPTIVPREKKFTSDTQLVVTLLAEDVAQACVLEVTVVNPEPGGGQAGPYNVQVAEAGP